MFVLGKDFLDVKFNSRKKKYFWNTFEGNFMLSKVKNVNVQRSVLGSALSKGCEKCPSLPQELNLFSAIQRH